MAKKPTIKDYIFFFLILSGFIAGFSYLLSNFQYDWNWSELTPYFFENKKPGLLIDGLMKTILISFCSIIFGLGFGFILALSSISKIYPLKWMSRILIELVRGTPLLVQLFIVYFMFGTVIGVDSGFVCAVIALSLFASCYVSEILRSGIEAIPQGQWDAAHVLGLNKYQTLYYIIIPQALKISLPALAGTFISLIKDSSLVSVLAIMDLTKAGREIISNTFYVFETWIIVAALYLLMTYPLSLVARKMEASLDRN